MGVVPVTEKYALEITPIVLAGKKLALYRVKNWEPFIADLGGQGEEYINAFPFWMKVWEASLILADHLVRMGIENGKEILEIGAGMGVVGLALGALGHKVTITDYEDDALELLRMNVEYNSLDNVSVRKLDWNRPDLTRRYDIICGSELVYKKQFIGPIINLFRNYLKPDGTIFMAHDVRRMCLIQFIGTVAGQFEIENIMKRLRSDEGVYQIVIHALRLKESVGLSST
jgi:tRNA1(Val) A37 N6-methylase TrmN6